MASAILELPLTDTREDVFVGTVYSNFDHEFDDEVLARLENGGVAQHAAYDFCGWVWRTEGGWVESVWRHHQVIATYGCADLATLIEHVIDEHGRA